MMWLANSDMCSSTNVRAVPSSDPAMGVPSTKIAVWVLPSSGITAQPVAGLLSMAAETGKFSCESRPTRS